MGSNVSDCFQNAPCTACLETDSGLSLTYNISRRLMWQRSDGLNICDVYTFQQSIARGSMGLVAKVVKTDTNGMYALKTIHLEKLTDAIIQELQNEINILMDLDHPNIIRALDLFTQNHFFYLVMELCNGGDLYTRLPYSESQSALIVNQVCSAVVYLHEKGIVHRDIKFENILFESADPDNIMVKLVDFGLSKVAQGRRMHDPVGTLYSVAPEVLYQDYTQACDMWSIGVVAYMLIARKRPFEGKTDTTVQRAITLGEYDMDGEIWNDKSPHSREFIQSLIRLSPSHRLTANDALRHPWLLQEWSEYLITSRKSNSTLQESDIISSLKKYGKFSKLRKAALMIIAHRAEANQVQALRDAFYSIDTAHAGYITLDELQNFVNTRATMTSEGEISRILYGLDVNQNGHVGFTEFVAATVNILGPERDVQLAEAFDQLDSDDSGFISRDNLQNLLGPAYTEQEIQSIINEADIRGYGQISFTEFCKVMEDEIMIEHKNDIRSMSTGTAP